MITEIAGKHYKIITTDAKDIRLDTKLSVPTIFVPANIDVKTLEQFIKNKKTNTAINEEISYVDEPIQLFQQNYILKIIKNSIFPKIIVKNRTISIYCKRNTEYQKQLKKWRKQFVLQQLADLIGYWEEELQILINVIKLRSMQKRLYTIQDRNSITFSNVIICLSISELKYLIFNAIAEILSLSPKIRKHYFPEGQLIQDQIAYTLKTCQQSN